MIKDINEKVSNQKNKLLEKFKSKNENKQQIKAIEKAKLKKDFKKYMDLYPFFIPAMLFAIVFAYIPMAGILVAFKDYNIFNGNNAIDAFFNSEWVGFEHFRTLFGSEKFSEVFKNTLVISIYKIVFLFPIPIVLAILITEVKNMVFNKGIQSVVYLPHFLSWAVVAGLFMTLLNPYGPINNFLISIGLMDGENPIMWFTDQKLFRSLLVTTAGWKEIGWSAIVYIAAIAAIDPSLYEAAKIDGASKLQQIWNITIPGISSTIAVLFIIRLGYLMEAGFEQIMTMYSAPVYKVADIIGTYVYREGMASGEYSFSTAVGLFNSVVALTLILSGNYLLKKFFERSIW